MVVTMRRAETMIGQTIVIDAGLFSFTIGKALAISGNTVIVTGAASGIGPRRCDRASGGWCEGPRSNRERR
jgi:hypothetical protein